MTNKTPDEIYEYVHTYKARLRDEYNEDQEKLFEASNKIKLQISIQQIVFSSVLISVGSGYLLSNPSPNVCVKNLLIVALFIFAISVVIGLYSVYLASEFWLKWARHAHEKGGMVYKDNSKTVEELEVLLEAIEKKSANMPVGSGKISTIIQTIFFLIGILLVLTALSIVTFAG